MTASAIESQRAVSLVMVRRTGWLRLVRVATGTRRGKVGLTLTSLVVMVAVIGPFVAPYSPTALVGVPFSAPSSHLLLGTDVLGRDVLSRVLCGGWVLLIMSVAATVLGVGVGAVVGIVAAYAGGVTDSVLMRVVDVLLAFPQLIFTLLLVSVIGPKLWLIVLAVGISHAPQVARVLRSATLEVSERDFIRAAELDDARTRQIMFRELVPNLISPLMVEIGLRMTYSIVVIAGLAFLGFGQAPPAPSWGVMISENDIGLAANVWAVVVPGAMIALLSIGVNTFTDALVRVVIGIEGRDSGDEPAILPDAVEAVR